MKQVFEVASGSVVGREHRLAGRSNQDGFHVFSDNDVTIAVVCDGCGSGESSEVGAKLGACLIVNRLLQHLRPPHNPQLQSDSLASPIFWGRLQRDLVLHIATISQGIDPSLSSAVQHFFLFTIVGVVITPEKSQFFSWGDGTLIVNGERIPLGPFPNNAPPYLSYGLTGTKDLTVDMLCFQLHADMPTADLQHFLIGTDGLDDLIAAEERTLPGKTEVIGPLSQFWERDHYFKNPDNIRRRLFLASQDKYHPNWEERTLGLDPGRLSDDTTIITGRRRSEEAWQLTT